MLFDALSVGHPSDLSYDICIVGAGAAGIALALEFLNTPNIRVCLLEGGGLDYADESQDLYRGEIVGRDYADLDTSRLRYFGGTTNHWAGYCLPFSENSFEARAWVPHSGWPITRQDLTPYYERAHTLLGLPRDGDWSADVGWTPEGLQRHYGFPRLEQKFEYFQENALMIHPLRMGEHFLEPLTNAKNIDVILNANATEVETNDLGVQARGVRVKTLDGKAFMLQANLVVLAAGGLENVRLLLSSTAVHADGIGNRNGLVGRYFSDHINLVPGEMTAVNPRLDLALYQRRSISDETESVVWHELTPEAQETFELIPCSVRLMSRKEALSTQGGRSLKAVSRNLSRGKIPDGIGDHVANIMMDIEQIGSYSATYLWHGNAPISKVVYEMSLAPAPNPDSRVTLGAERDRLGLRRLELDWRLSDIDFKTIRWASSAFADTAAAHGMGRSMLELDDAELSENVRWTWHHMCTTRMSDSATQGVVDSNCRIHDMQNLYVAGSSVFSTAGWGTPTFLIIALAMRLGDHLKGQLAA